jgi:hypothetical protein
MNGNTKAKEASNRNGVIACTASEVFIINSSLLACFTRYLLMANLYFVFLLLLDFCTDRLCIGSYYDPCFNLCFCKNMPGLGVGVDAAPQGFPAKGECPTRH